MKAWLRDFKTAKEANQGSLFHKSFFYVLLSACLPVALISGFMYIYSKHQVEEQVNQTHRLELRYFVQRQNEQLSQLKLAALQLSYNPLLPPAEQLDFLDNFQYFNDLLRALINSKNISPLVQNVYMYVANKGQILSGNRGIVSLDQTGRSIYSDMLGHENNLFWMPNLTLPDATSEGTLPMTLVVKLPADYSRAPYGLLLIELNRRMLNEQLQELNPRGEGAAFILDQNGGWITSGRSAGDNAKLEEELRRQVMAYGGQSGLFASSIGKVNYSVSFHTEDGGWTYVSAVPMTQLTQPALMATRVVLLSGFCIMLTAVGMAWFISRRIYHPIRQLIEFVRGNIVPDRPVFKARELQFIEERWMMVNSANEQAARRLQEYMPVLKEGFMLQFLLGQFSYLSEEETLEKLAGYGWDVQGKQYFIFLVQILGLRLQDKATRYAQGDEQLVTFAAFNIIEELVEARFMDQHVINFQNMTVGVVLMLPRSEPQAGLKEQINPFLKEITQVVTSLLKLDVVIGIGEVTSNIREVPAQVKKAREAIHSRSLSMQETVWEKRADTKIAAAPYCYPADLEKEIVEALKNGDEVSTLELAERFIQELNRRLDHLSLVQQGLMLLFSHIQKVVAQSGYQPFTLKNDENPYIRLYHIHEPKDMLRWFVESVIQPYLPYFREMVEERNQNSQQMVANVIETIKTGYMAEDLSLEACALQAGVSAYALSRAFKTVAGVNFIDYLTDVRMMNAKMMLANSNAKISDIAAAVGYQPPYFNRIFKRMEGMTPREYRQRMNKYYKVENL